VSDPDTTVDATPAVVVVVGCAVVVVVGVEAAACLCFAALQSAQSVPSSHVGTLPPSASGSLPSSHDLSWAYSQVSSHRSLLGGAVVDVDVFAAAADAAAVVVVVATAGAFVRAVVAGRGDVTFVALSSSSLSGATVVVDVVECLEEAFEAFEAFEVFEAFADALAEVGIATGAFVLVVVVGRGDVAFVALLSSSGAAVVVVVVERPDEMLEAFDAFAEVGVATGACVLVVVVVVGGGDVAFVTLSSSFVALSSSFAALSSSSGAAVVVDVVDCPEAFGEEVVEARAAFEAFADALAWGGAALALLPKLVRVLLVLPPPPAPVPLVCGCKLTSAGRWVRLAQPDALDPLAQLELFAGRGVARSPGTSSTAVSSGTSEVPRSTPSPPSPRSPPLPLSLPACMAEVKRWA
jgi:hypothetical protein